MRRNTNFANLGGNPEFRTVLDALERRDARAKGGAKPPRMPRPARRGKRAPPAPAKPVPAPVPVAPVVEETPWAIVEDSDAEFSRGAYEYLDLPAPPWAQAPQAKPTPMTIPATEAGPKVLRLDTGFRVEDASAILVVVVVCHAATWVGGMIGFGSFLPWPVAIGIPTLTVWVGLALIAGLGRDSLGWVRRAVIVAFTLVNVYGSFYAWNDLLAGEGAETEMARSAHRELRTEVFVPLETAATDAESAAVAAERKCEDESSQRRGGYGTRARALCDTARDLRAVADTAAARRDALAPYFDDDVFALAPAQMWDQAALVAGVAGIDAPPRDAYYEVPLLRGLTDLRHAKTAAIVALLAALFIDLAGISLGRGLHRH